MNKTDIIERKMCTGCGACLNACPKKCISMREDEDGFLFPIKDIDKCVGCGKCLKVCPVNAKKPTDNKPRCYAAWNNDTVVRNKSSSGGVFSLIASEIIAQGGVVFGAAFDEKFDVQHIFIDKIEDLPRLQGSKYVQSDAVFCYSTARKILDGGRKVLFSGTPCQIAGLLSYLGKDYPDLYTQDIICHGVPSRRVWREYLRGVENKIGKAKSVEFRNKDNGWNSYGMKIVGSNAVFYKEHTQDIYNKCFIRNKALRLSCYDCAFKTRFRPSDITLADFWGIEKKYPELSDDKGVSLVMVNSVKGAELFSRAQSGLTFAEVDVDFALSNNTAAETAAEKPRDREKFFKIFRHSGFIKAYDKLYGDPDNKFFNRIKNKIKSILNGKENG